MDLMGLFLIPLFGILWNMNSRLTRMEVKIGYLYSGWSKKNNVKEEDG